MKIEPVHIQTFRRLLKECLEGKEAPELLVDYYIQACDIQYEMGKETGYSIGSWEEIKNV